jgi:dihydropteroate synthase
MVKDTFFAKKHWLNCRGSYLDLASPKIMGILNITPDSFYDGGKYQSLNDVLSQVDKMVQEGADIIDIGAYSSRPGAKHISKDEELGRLTGVIGAIRKNYYEQILSVDTFRSEIARIVVKEYEIDIINDISGGNLDNKMYEVVSDLQVPYIIMHMPGDPRSMQKKTNYNDLLKDIISNLGEKVSLLHQKGIHDIIIDPGFGFGKTLDQNYQILAHLHEFQILDEPLIVGISRKSMIFKQLELSPEDALNGTTALHMQALTGGANILRVHDVKEAGQTIQLFNKLKDEGIKYTDQNR